MKLFYVLALALFLSTISSGQKIVLDADILPRIVKEYKYLHQNPELSYHEVETAKHLADFMREIGFEVTENIGGNGVVCVLKNGPGKTILVRADTDALPIKETTGLDYASKKTTKDDNGNKVGVMHACGHDIHMSSWMGAAWYLTKHKKEWSGTLVFIAQPAEERSGGAKNMIKDGLFTRFPLPDYALALHVSSSLPAGTIGWKAEYAMANVDMIEITVHGKGGHGAYPHTTVDPIAMAARLILDLQTIVSREISPTDPAVLTVGSIHGGTKGNVIPNDVKLELTLRSYTDEVREKMIAALKRKCEALGYSAGLEKNLYPVVNIREEFTPALYNNLELVQKIVPVFYREIGEDNVFRIPAVMGGEDFGMYGRTKHKIPIFMFRLGSVNVEKHRKAKESGTQLPSTHNSGYYPDPEPTLRTGIIATSAAVMELMKDL